MENRHDEILKILAEERQVKIEPLAKRFNVSIETIRRDLKALEKRQLIRRVHGGAVYDSLRARETAFDSREIKNPREKRAVAKATADLINDGDALAISNGTSTLEVAKALSGKNCLTVVTNSIQIAQEMVENDTNDVYLISGRLRKEGLGLSGTSGCEYLRKFRVDKAILSVGGISIDHGVTDYHVEEAEIMRTMLEIANQKIVITDYTKLTLSGLNKICDVKDVDIIVSDWNTPIREQNGYRELGVKVHIADPVP